MGRKRLPVSHRLRVCFAAYLFTAAVVHAHDLATPGLIDRSERLKLPDYLQFYTYGSLVLEGARERLYDPGAHADVARRRVHPQMQLFGFRPNYNPAVAFGMVPFAALPFGWSMAAFSLCTIALYATSAWLLVGVLPRLRGDLPTFALAAAAWPVLMTILRHGQFAAVTLLLFTSAVVLHARGRAFVAGLVLGLAVYKPQLLVVPGLVWLVAREWRLLAGLICGAGAELAVSLLLTSPSTMAAYVAVLWDLARHPEVVQINPPESHSIRGLARLLGASSVVASVVGGIALAASAAIAALVWVRDRSLVAWAVLVLAVVLSSPHLLTYDLVLLGIPLAIAVEWHLVAGAGGRLLPYTAGALYLAPLVSPYIARVTRVQASTLAMGVLVAWLWGRTAPAPQTSPAQSASVPAE